MSKLIIDFKGAWYKNCKKRRKEQAKICKNCPFKKLIQQEELDYDVR